MAATQPAPHLPRGLLDTTRYLFDLTPSWSGPPERMRPGLQCAGRSWGGQPRPERWGDDRALQQFLTGLVADAASRAHAVTRLRGAQAGFLLHGLCLELPDTLATTAAGPGLTSVPVTADTARAIAAGCANPVYAAALAAALFTGADPLRLIDCAISGLSAGADVLAVSTTGHGALPVRPPVVFHVPEPARPLLRAARTFLQLRGAAPSKRLLAAGIGPDAGRLFASAENCGLSLPTVAASVNRLWHTSLTCSWVGTPLHDHPGAPL